MLRHKPVIKPHRKPHKAKPWQALMSVLAAATICLLWVTVRSWHRLQAALPPAGQVPGTVDDKLVEKIVQECMLRQNTLVTSQHGAAQQVVAYTSAQQMQKRTADRACPLFHIPLSADDRSIGLCTDAALYVQLLGAQIVPDTQSGLQQAQACGPSSAVLLLEPLYDTWTNWLIANPKVVAVYAPNFEHVFAYDKDAHKRMQLILCKVYRCNELMDAYMEDISSNAILVYTGHTSLDPLVFAPNHKHLKLPRKHLKPAARHLLKRHPSSATRVLQQAYSAIPAAQFSATRQRLRQLLKHRAPAAPRPKRLAASAQPAAALHVRGKSSLKHTKQLLDCWLKHPEWPQLTVLGPMPNEQITLQETKQYLAAANIVVPRPGKAAGPGWPAFDPVPNSELAFLLLSHPIHIMPSEREGFGHSINEGRAAGALLVVPDHPPMNELVQPGVGVLIKPEATFSHTDAPVPALGKYANISASISPEGICEAVSHALEIDPQRRTAMGLKARRAFESDRKDFEQRMRQVQALVQKMVESAVADDAKSSGGQSGQ